VAYVVLARKYRPQRFADLVGQEHVTRTLANAIAHNRVHHAYLFCGARGLGKTTAARLLAKCLVCIKGPTIDPCNLCSECTAVTEGRSVDVIEIDGASNNRVEDVRNLRDQVRYLPQTARRKIYIIDEVHMLTGSAFNALLKTLEEPPDHVTFIFATTEVHELPATILSRVSRFDFRRMSSAQLVAHLQHILSSEGVSVEEAGLYTVARAGDGSVRDSLTLLDKVIAFASDTNKVSADEVRIVLGVPGALAVAGLVEAVLARDPTLTLRRFDEVFASGQDLLALALEFLKHLRDLTITKLCGTRDVLVDASDAEFEQLTTQATGVDSVVLSQLFDRFTRVVDALPRTRVPRLVLEMGLLDLVHGEPLIPLGDLIDRLEQISTGASGGGGGPQRTNSSPAARSNPAPARPASDPRARAEASTTAGRPPAMPDSSPYSKILASAGLVGPEPAVLSPKSGVERPRSAGHASADMAPSESPARPSDASWGPDEPRGDPQTAAAQTPPKAAALRSEQPRAAACDAGGCPGSPQPEAEGVVPWANLPQLAAWEQFLGRLQIYDDGPLFAILADLGLEKLGDGVLRLAGTSVAFARNHLRDQAPLRAHLESLLQQHLGSPFRLELIEGEPSLPDLPSLSLVEARRREELQVEVEREADASPQILALKAQFAAQVRNVRPRVAPSRYS